MNIESDIPEDIQILACDPKGQCTGRVGRITAHSTAGTLHRAFSAILVDEIGRVVLQRRSAMKMLWPGYWSNSCCSHYRAIEDGFSQVEQRIQEELGCTASRLEHATCFQYRAVYADVGLEMEVCDVWLGTARSEDISPNPREADAVAFVNPRDLGEALVGGGLNFTPWFTLQWPIVRFRLENLIHC